MTEWLDAATTCRAAGEEFVIVTVVGVRGSAPREVGTRMLVTSKETIGTIGGGQLEYRSTQYACEMLKRDERERRQERRFVLGADCGQCCGGVVDVIFECGALTSPWLDTVSARYRVGEAFVLVENLGDAGERHLVSAAAVEAAGGRGRCPPQVIESAHDLLHGSVKTTVRDGYLLERIGFSGMHIAVFGAGHVGAALVDVLSRLDCRVRWIDSRPDLLPGTLSARLLPVPTDDPAREVMAMPPESFYVVATHSHPLDLDVCDAVLRRRDFAYCGLIGSRSKRQRFRRRLRERGIDEGTIARLTCPIGVAGISGRQPVEIALATAAEILQWRDRRQSGSGVTTLEASA